jgi:hypothetical protein
LIHTTNKFNEESSLRGSSINTDPPQTSKGPSDDRTEVGEYTYDNEKNGNRPCEEDEEASSGDGEGLTEGIFCQVPKNQSQDQRDDRIIEFLHDVAKYPESEHHPDIEEVVVDGEGPNRCKNHNEAHQDRIWHSQDHHKERYEKNIHQKEDEIPDELA